MTVTWNYPNKPKIIFSGGLITYLELTKLLWVLRHSMSSKLGWGAINKYTGDKTGGRWSPSEKDLRANMLELKSCQLALKSFLMIIRVNMDNSVSVAYLNKLGGGIHQLDALARQIWLWCLDRKYSY